MFDCFNATADECEWKRFVEQSIGKKKQVHLNALQCLIYINYFQIFGYTDVVPLNKMQPFGEYEEEYNDENGMVFCDIDSVSSIKLVFFNNKKNHEFFFCKTDMRLHNEVDEREKGALTFVNWLSICTN
jgi:hypothetical protein